MFGDKPLLIVDTPETLADCVASLSSARVIGVDTESDGFYHYREKVCLLQFSDLERDYIVDPLALSDLSSLAPIFADPNIVKVFHGADYDVVSLKRDLHVEINTIFDTMVASQFLGFSRLGLADLIHQFFDETVDKSLQRYDWSLRPLYDEHLTYARGDTHFLLAIYEIMRHKLQRAGRLKHVEEECVRLSQRAWHGRDDDPADFLRLKGTRQLSVDSLRALRALYRFREQEAAALDRPVFKVLPEEALLEVARLLPRTEEALQSCFRPNSSLLRRYGRMLLEIIEQALVNPTPLPPFPAPLASTSLSRSHSRETELLFQRLKLWRNRTVAEKGLAPVAVLSNALIKAVASAAPTTPEALEAIPDLRAWQIEQFGEELLEEVRAVLDLVAQEGSKKRRKKRPKRKAEAAPAATCADE